MCGSSLKNNPQILAISGVKNSGKTTYLEKIINELRKKDLKIAVIKHDGHDFEADVKGTDSYRYAQAGAYGTAVFSKNKFMAVKACSEPNEKELMKLFPEADIILIEGLKNSEYSKIELIRKEISNESVCSKETLMAIVTDTEIFMEGVPVLGFEDIAEMCELIL
ncbi:MAG: molybdopterin-guanine dinucleotide biosynthesis protein B, partial [Eubacterium sp.]